MSIGKICKREVDCAESDESVSRAADRMRDRMVGCLVVLNKARQPIGILTDRDVTLRIVAANRDPCTTTVEEVMTREPKIAKEETSIERAVSLMRRGAFRRLPVIDDAGELIGLVTLDDILMSLCDEFSSIGALLDRETPASAAAR
jgi:CBS domain-containing protein